MQINIIMYQTSTLKDGKADIIKKKKKILVHNFVVFCAPGS